jgi:hypothetical protein
MTTVVVARKGNTVAIAADTLVTFGDTRLGHGYEANLKMFKAGDSWIGMAGTTAHFPVARRALASLPPDELKLHSRDEVFETFLKLHPKLKENFFLNPKEEDADPSSSIASGASAPAARSRSARCSRPTTRPRPRAKCPRSACAPAVNSTRTPVGLFMSTPSN